MKVWWQSNFGARLCVTHQSQHTPVCQSRPNARRAAAGSLTTAELRAFTLVELIVVMALLVSVIALASPSLAGFFRGRAVDAEARRLMSLTRLGQSRAAAEGLPMILWVDLQQRTYGLEADSSFVEEDAKAVEYTLDGNVTMEVGATEALPSAITSDTLFGSAESVNQRASLPHIRFEPDGSISDGSRENLQLLDRDGNPLWVGLAANRLNYEIRSQEMQRTTTRR
jgi:prepilin-type N-terminal cleavage/methylation domain-containing protein